MVSVSQKISEKSLNEGLESLYAVTKNYEEEETKPEQYVVGFFVKCYWWFTDDRDISPKLEEARIFPTLIDAQSFIENLRIGELPKDGLMLHAISLADAQSLLYNS